jgi:predicted O-methyltransferase YrrM
MELKMRNRFQKSLLLMIILVCGISSAFSDSDPAVFHVPRVEGLTVDASGSDWGSQGFRVEVLANPDGKTLPVDNFDVRFRLGWDGRGLYVLATVRDDVAVEHENPSRLWRCDCLEIAIAEDVGHSNSYMLAVAPGADPKHGKLRKRPYDWRPEADRPANLAFETASQIVDGGYVVEALLPWKNLGIKPRMGKKIGLQFVANDDDGLGSSFRVAWFPEISPADSTKMQGLILSDESSEPLLMRIDRKIDSSGYVIAVQGVRDLMGEKVVVRSGDEVLAQKMLTGKDGRAHAIFEWKRNENVDVWPQVSLEVSGKNWAEFGEIPTIDAILEAYIRAVGGREAFTRLTTRSCNGCYLLSQDKMFRFQALAQVPYRWTLSIHNADSIEKNGFDGAIGWAQTADRIERADHFSRAILGWWLNPQGPVELQKYFPDLHFKKMGVREGNTVHVLESAEPDGVKRVLEFESDTGLLRRIDNNVILEDYRKIDGAALPFRVVINGREPKIFELVEVRHNVAVDDRLFAMPDAADVFPDAFQGIDDSKVLPMLKMEDLSYRHGEMNIPCRDGRFLYDLIIKNGYRNGLEIGTYNGYSTLWLGLAFRETGGKVTTIEVDPGPARQARQSFVKAGLGEVIDARINDAFGEIAELEGKFDFIFIDANKEDYGKFLEVLKSRLKPGGALLGHNVTNAAREMKDFLDAIQNDPDFETTFHPVSAEGISVSINRHNIPVEDDRFAMPRKRNVSNPRSGL